MDVSLNTPSTDSPSSPTFIGLKSAKRPLPDVQEEPQERDEDFDMFNEAPELYDCFCKSWDNMRLDMFTWILTLGQLGDDHRCTHRDLSMIQSTVQLSSKPDFEYDLADGFFSDGEVGLSPRSKKRRAAESFTTLASRIGTRFPSFSRKWRVRRGTGNATIEFDSQRERTKSRAASSRSSSLTNSIRQGFEKSYEPQLPLTPAKSIFDEDEEIASLDFIDVERANRNSGEREEGFATTPLLPPLMVEASANTKHVSLQSPLQSPSVAESAEHSIVNSPIDMTATPQILGMPSPPLSTRPSISSFHRAQLNRPGHLVPSSEIPPIVIADADDEWSYKLGHANFTIHPEPYSPDVFDIEACRQMRANWDLARCNYTKHLVRTGEHYGVTSKTYKMTEEKWSQIDAIWKKNNDLTIQNTVENDGDAFSRLKHNPFGEPSSSIIMTKIPSLNDPTSGGKFPQLGDEDIVGPMVQATAQLQRSPSKKTKLIKFFVEKFPTGLGRALS